MKKIQLWSDEKGGEFAICLSGSNGAFFSQTNPHTKYVKMVEEAEYIEGERYDWPYMLAKWIDNRNGNENATGIPYIPDTFNHRSSFAPPNRQVARKKRKKYTKQTPTLKCHFCGLMYVSERERESHEKEWHASSQKKAS